MSSSEERQKKWREEVKSFQRSGLSYVKYCEAKDFSPSTLRYWETKLGFGRSPKVPSAFTPIRVERPSKSSAILPDPKWVAELIKALALTP